VGKLFKKILTKKNNNMTTNNNFSRLLQRQQLLQRMVTNLPKRALLTAPQLDRADVMVAEDVVDTPRTIET
jgi:hypothetical protein